MTIIKKGNWSRRDPGDEIPDGATIAGGNFSQVHPDTPIMVGKPLTIHGGNWANVRKDPAWTVTKRKFPQVSRCAHVNPDFPELSCPENCEHVVDTHELLIDGVVVETIYEYADKRVN